MSPQRLLRPFVALILVVGLVSWTGSPAQALSFRSRPASQWLNYYAGKSDPGANLTSNVGGKNATSNPTNFIVNYTNFPDAAKTVFDAAVSIWASLYPSTAPITINATWANLGPGILGSARPGSFFSDFNGAPDRSLWYPSALANALAGKDLDPANPEIVARFSSNSPWYLGTDGLPPPGRYDLETAVLHELCHGLGFLSSDSYDASTGIGLIDEPTPFDAFLRTSDDRRLSDIASPSRELGTLLTSPLSWAGAFGVGASNGTRPKIYAPSTYSDGSSVSHLDEATYPSGTPNTLMTPQLEPGEVIHDPGPITLGILADLRTKPPAGPVTSLPSAPINPVALVGDASALITFDPPVDARVTQVTSYLVRVTPGGFESQSVASPIKVRGLKSGISYTFTIKALNSLGAGPPAYTDPIIPQANWKSTTVDPHADPNFVSTTTFHKSLTVIYSDSATGDLKRATRVGTRWRIETIDGPGAVTGGTSHNLNGALSTCISGTGTKELLHVFYTDTDDKDLRHATYDGKHWKFEIVDGNGPVVQAVNDPIRVRTASDVSVSNACVATRSGLQVFYRDDSQGILLGATLVGSAWKYELVDGDRISDERTTGDVAFHLAAVSLGGTAHVLYDSVLKIDRDRKPMQGEVRDASRNSSNPSAWRYRTIDATSTKYPVSGYGISLTVSGGKVFGGWLSASNASLGTPVPDTIDWANLNASIPFPLRIPGGNYGAPTTPLALSARTMLYGCQGRLCAIDLVGRHQSLVSDKQPVSAKSAAFATVGGKTGLLVGSNLTLRFFKP